MPAGPFRVALADRIGFLDGAGWDAVTAVSTWWLSRPALRAVELAGPANIATRYALIYRDERPAAAAVLQSVDLDGSRIGRPEAGGRLGQAARRVRSRVLGGVKFRLHVCGNLLCGGRPAVAFAPGESPAETWPAVATALDRLRPTGSRTDLTLLGDFRSGDPAPSALPGYRALPTEPDMILAVPAAWKSYDDYLGSLTSKARKNATRLRTELQTAGCRLELVSARDRAADLYRLYLEVHHRARWRLVTSAPGWLSAVEAAAGPDGFRCTGILRGDELLGFVTTVRDGDQVIAYQVGFSSKANADVPLYFSLLHAAIGDGIALGAKSISFGRTALDPKSKLGAKPAPLTVRVRHDHPALNALLRPLVDAVRAPAAPVHHPFKEEETAP